MDNLTIRDSTINVPIDIDKKLAERFMKILVEEEESSKIRHAEISVALGEILNELRAIRKKKGK